ncbi:hypothetical protein QL285_008366 [Trifolium repens]|nr:hypothetical protein QL285_008366 [Trifolium repens]
MKGCKSFERGKINKSLRQETTSMPSSGGSHDRRKAISVEAVYNSTYREEKKRKYTTSEGNGYTFKTGNCSTTCNDSLVCRSKLSVQNEGKCSHSTGNVYHGACGLEASSMIHDVKP